MLALGQRSPLQQVRQKTWAITVAAHKAAKKSSMAAQALHMVRLGLRAMLSALRWTLLAGQSRSTRTTSVKAQSATPLQESHGFRLTGELALLEQTQAPSTSVSAPLPTHRQAALLRSTRSTCQAQRSRTAQISWRLTFTRVTGHRKPEP